MEGQAQSGHRCFTILPPPIGAGQRLQVYFDPLEYPELLQTRDQYAIPGSDRDCEELLARNHESNRALGPFEDWKQLWGREQGKTCRLICAGPSLQESLPELAVSADDTFTLGFNRSHRMMDLDYFVSVDRTGQEDWITRDTGETIFIGGTTTAPHVAAEFKNRYWGDLFVAGVDDDLEPIRVGLSLTLNDAMYVAYRLGASKIELYGCDFAISGYLAVDELGKNHYKLDRYYTDQRSSAGTARRAKAFPECWPVWAKDGRVVFINYEMMANASYTTVMCLALMYQGVEVVNKSTSGILFWGMGASHEE